MGHLANGKWVQGSVITSDTSGAYDRKPRTFHDTVATDHPRFTPDSDRYHLYVSLACPWAHRTLIMRELKGLQDHIGVSVVHPDLLDEGWTFARDFPGATGDALGDRQFLYEVYQAAQSDVTTTVTVPVLWDKQQQTIVNNESSEIIRIFNSGFAELSNNDTDYYPEALRGEIDSWNDRIYDNVNNGVYRAGFAKSRDAYSEAVLAVFELLDVLEKHLDGKDYLVGGQLTEADVRLVTTLLRFDIVYYTHFKCNVRRILDYPNLARYRRQLYELDAVRSTTDFEHIKRHYYYSHGDINPHRIVPEGPAEYL